MTIVQRNWCLSLAAAVMCFALAPAGAQQTFELGEEGFESIEAPAPGSAAADMHEIRKLIAEGNGKQAEKQATEWIKSHRNHPMLPEAYLLSGDAKASRSHYYRALYDYEYLLRRYPDSDQFHTALERELRIAQTFANGTKRRLWGMRIMPAGGEAEELLIRVQERAPSAKIAEEAGKELADFYYRRSEMLLAAEAYGLFVANYPRSQWREQAMMRRIDANMATFKGPRFDATGLLEARSRLSDLKEKYPGIAEQNGADERLGRIDESLAQKALVAARWYDGQNRMVSAKFMYQRVVDEHPDTVAAREAQMRLAELNPSPSMPTDETDESEN